MFPLYKKKHRPYENASDEELCGILRDSPRQTAEAAFTEIFRRYSARVHAYCYRIIGDHEEAEDIFQETFKRFHETVKAGKPMTNVPGFLLTVAKNQCLNVKKARGRRQMLPIQDYDFRVNDPGLEKAELLELIVTALELLEFDYREAFVLREYDGLPYARIAEQTGTTVATAKIRVFRAKQKIKDILMPYLKDLLQNS